jgi:signal transduction histidine kinase
VLLLILVISSMSFLRQSNEDEFQKRAHTTTRLFAAAVQDAVLATDLATLESTAAAVLENPDIVYARVRSHGRVLAQAGDAGALARPFRADTGIDGIDDEAFDAGAEIRVEGSLEGEVEIGLSVGTVRSVLRAAKTRISAIAGAEMGLVALFSFILGLYLTRNLDALREGAQRLGAGELGYQIAVHGRDELALTARTFNDMSRRLAVTAEEREAAEAELRRYEGHLEQLVTQRTAELTRANEELVAANHKLEQTHSQLLQSEKMASVGQLAAGVAHEINNPIGFVISNMGSLERYLRDLLRVIDAYEAGDDDPAADPARLAAVRAAKKAVELEYLKTDVFDLLAESNDGLQRVRRIVKDMKDFSHVSNPVWQRADVHAILDSALNIAHNELKYKAEVVKEYGTLDPVECLAQELGQVFMNLLVNAGQAIAEWGQITVRTGNTGSEVWVEVADNGDGIPPENLNRIFDPFFTTKPVGQGTGLGLSLSYGIVQKHGGRFEVESALGKGTRFRVWLPLRQAQQAPKTAENV